MQNLMDTVFYQPLGFRELSPWLILTLFVSVPQALILMNLGWRSIGLPIRIKDSIVPAAILSLLTGLSRRLVIVPYHVLVFATLLFCVIYIVGRTRLLMAFMATIFTETVIISGSVIIIEPILALANKDMQNFLIESPIGFSIGIALETIIPMTVLFVLIHYKISLFGRTREDAAHRGT